MADDAPAADAPPPAWPWAGQRLVDEGVPAQPPRPPPRYLRDERRIVYEELDPFGYEPLDRSAEAAAEPARLAARLPPPLAVAIATLEAHISSMEPTRAPVPTADELRAGRAAFSAPPAPPAGAPAAEPPAAELRELEPELADMETAGQLLAARTGLGAFAEPVVLRARAETNPAEKLATGPFLCRAALKLAELDARTGFVLTAPFERDYDTGVVSLDADGELQFADLCGAPGGWAEYLLWRRGPRRARGWGLTLRADGCADYALERFGAHASPAHGAFRPLYGADGTGDVTVADNVWAFCREVVPNTRDAQGVHICVADGGRKWGADEGRQEGATRRLLLCQAACALLLVRPGGRFILKCFGLATRFSAGLVALLRAEFEHVAGARARGVAGRPRPRAA